LLPENEHFDVLRMDSRPHIKQSFNNAKQERAPTTHPGIERESKNGTVRLQSRDPESIVNMSSKSLTKAQSSLLREYFHDTDRSDDGLEDDAMMYKKERSVTTSSTWFIPIQCDACSLCLHRSDAGTENQDSGNEASALSKELLILCA